MSGASGVRGVSGSKIKGGGSAIMSDATKQALISLLMQLRGPSGVDEATAPSSSDHSRKRNERRFLKDLVEEYERKQLSHRYNLTSIPPEKCELGGARGDSITVTIKNSESSRSVREDKKMSTTTNSASPTASVQKDSGEKVRVEFVEAIFKSSPDKKKSSNQDDAKSKNKKKTGQQHNLGFKEGIRKVAVVNKTTTIKDICKQGQSKLNMKKRPVRAFLVLSGDETATGKPKIVDLETDLSGVDDGTYIYLSLTPAEDTTHRLQQQIDQSMGKDGESEEETTVAVDPLDQVKQAYKQQNRQTSHRRRGGEKEQQLGSSAMPTKEIMECRAKLPIAACKTVILSTIRSNLVTIICAATGTGKSTQISQFILDDQQALNFAVDDRSTFRKFDGSAATRVPTHHVRPYILVTQPRRVAAISLAQRVSEEVGYGPPGTVGSRVGYIVRLDRSVADESCRIIYCTIGVLLRMLVCPKDENDDDSNTAEDQLPPLSIDTISHLVLDEVHERDVQTDFCLTLLKGMLPSRPDLRLVLMSATASADKFVDFFSPTTKKMALSIPGSSARPQVLEIPGRTFPVDIKYLPECERFACARSSQPAFVKHTNVKSDESDDRAMLSPRATEKIDNRFIRSLIAQIVTEQQNSCQLRASRPEESSIRHTGAILVFMPGKAEIEALARCLKDSDGPEIFRNGHVCKVLKLHSSIPRQEQQAVFRPAKMGTVKIVISTNIAETSVTIPDVSHVIDTGRVKECRYNSQTRIKELVTVWTSQASMNQRAGRAGRTSAGVCWRLVSQDFYNEALIEHTAPEMVRTPLDELILQICLLYEHRRDEHMAKQNAVGRLTSDNSSSFPIGVRPIHFLSKTPTPPPMTSLIEACHHLLEIDALQVIDHEEDSESDELSRIYRLSALGYHLSRLPMDSKVGKVLLVGCILGCLDGALTIAAALSCNKLCFIPNNGSKKDPSIANAFQARDALIANGFGGRDWPGGTVKSDLVAIIAAYRAWSTHKGVQKWKFSKSHAIDNLAMEEIQHLRIQFLESLKDAGFVSRSYNEDGSASTFDDCNIASDDALLTSCCLVAGLYPNICTLLRPQKGRKFGRLLTKDGDVCRPSSNSFQISRVKNASESGKDAYAVYHAKHKSIGTATPSSNGGPQRLPETFLSEVNFVSRFALLLFGGKLEIKKNAIIVDQWLKFKVDQESSSSTTSRSTTIIENAVLIQALRQELDKLMSEHIIENCIDGNERNKLLERHKAVLQVVRQLLMEEG